MRLKWFLTLKVQILGLFLHIEMKNDILGNILEVNLAPFLPHLTLAKVWYFELQPVIDSKGFYVCTISFYVKVRLFSNL